MRYVHKLSAAAAIAFLGLSSAAYAVPSDPSPHESGVSSCALRGTSGFFDCDIYEGPNETSTLTLPNSVGGGNLVLLENATDGQGFSNWSDVAMFNGATLTFLSDPAFFSDINVNLYLVEDPSGVTAYFSGGSQGVNNDYFFHSDPDQQQVPEPATLTLLGVGLMGMAATRRRKKQQA